MQLLSISLDSVDNDAVESAASFAETLAKTPPEKLWETYKWPLISTLVVLVIGYFVIKLVSVLLENGLRHSRMDKGSHKIIISSVKILLWLVVILTAASMLGIPMASTIALFGVFALAVSLAIKDGLSHFAGGIMILASKPFTVGDYIESKAEEVSGTVMDIGLIHTRLRTTDNRQVYVPNGVLIASTVINSTKESTRILNLVFPISYASDYKKAKQLIQDVVDAQPTVSRKEKPVIRISEFGSSSVNILCRVWADRDSHEKTKFDILEGVMDAFGANGIEIPFSQLDVHIRDGAAN